MRYGLATALAAGPNWAVMRDVAREGDWVERAIHAGSGDEAAADLGRAIGDLQHARAYWLADGRAGEAATVQTVIDHLQAYAGEAPGLQGQALSQWQGRLYGYQQRPRAAWRLYLEASGQVEVAAVTAALVVAAADLRQVVWVGLAAAAGGFAGALLGASIGSRHERRLRGG